MERMFWVGTIGLFLLLGCHQKTEEITKRPPYLKMEKLYTDEQLNDFLRMLRKDLAHEEIDFNKAKWELADLGTDDYLNFRRKIVSMGEMYRMAYKYQEIRDSLAIDIKSLAEKFVENNIPLLLIYGIGSDSLAIRHNSFENKINLKFIGCNGDYILPKSEVINSRFPNTGRSLRLTGNYNYYPNPHHKSLNSIYKNIAFQKFNEATIAALEKKYNFKVVDKVLNRELDWF